MSNRTLRLVATVVFVVAAASGVTGAQGTRHVVPSGDIALTVYEAGNTSGPAIVFIHGFGGSYLSWVRQFSDSSLQRFHLVAFDLRGHGASDKPLAAEQYTNPDLWAADLAAVIAAMELVRPVVVGWSYRGFVIADYVRKFGEGALGGIVFVGWNPRMGTHEAAGFDPDEALRIFGDVASSDVASSISGTRALTRMYSDPPGGDAWETSFGSTMIVAPQVRREMSAEYSTPMTC